MGIVKNNHHDFIINDVTANSVTCDLGVKGGERDSESLQRREWPLQIHRKFVFTDTPKLRKKIKNQLQFSIIEFFVHELKALPVIIRYSVRRDRRAGNS